MELTKRRRSGHAVLLPYPAQGHISPMMKLAKLLHSPPHNFHISFVNTHHNHRRFQRARGPAAVSGLDGFKFHVIPDGLPAPENQDATQDIAALSEEIRKGKTCSGAFRDLISELNLDGDGDDWPGPVSCVVGDAAMEFAPGVAEEFGVPAVRFWTASACSLWGYSQFQRLINKGVFPVPDLSCLTNGYLDKVVEGITTPEFEGITLKHLPSFIKTANPAGFFLHFMSHRVLTIANSRCPVIFNTFEALEGPTLKALAASGVTNTPVFSVGPLSLLHETTTVVDEIRPSLLSEDPNCISWLHSKPSNSVVYINFGSVATLTPQQIVEFAWGVVNSNQYFLWVIRPDLVGSRESGSASLAHDILLGAQGRGKLASWCDQEKVLAHPSVGGFLTHCGWNSTIEAIGHGVPVLCWPFFADQTTNCWFCCEKLGIGVEIGGEVKREEVEMVVKKAVVEGDDMRKKASEWKRLAEEATVSPKGTSYLNLEKLVNHLRGYKSFD